MSPRLLSCPKKTELPYHIYRRHPGRAKRAPGPISRLECVESWVPARRFAPSGMTAICCGLQKQTRPDANVRAGRFDRRGGGWGRTRRSQLSDPRAIPGRTFAHYDGVAQKEQKYSRCPAIRAGQVGPSHIGRDSGRAGSSGRQRILPAWNWPGALGPELMFACAREWRCC